MTSTRQILIVGAGLAGARCAETLRAEGFDGWITLVGEEAHAPYERPALSKEFLSGSRTANDLLLRPNSFWREQRIDLLLGERVVSVDVARRSARTERNRSLRWNTLVLATGARPRRLPFHAPPGVHVLRTLAEASTLRRQFRSFARLVVVGGGFVGSEVASTALSLGLDVTMLELDSAPLVNVLGREVGGILATRYRAYGADVRCGARAVAFKAGASGRVNRVVLAEGNDVPCDIALVAVGVEPARELIPTPTQSIVVCGDAAGGPGHWTSAARSGVNAARRLVGIEPLASQPSFFWSDQFGLRIQLVGDPGRAEKVHIDGDEGSFVARYVTRTGALAGALVANRPTAVAELRRELAFAA